MGKQTQEGQVSRSSGSNPALWLESLWQAHSLSPTGCCLLYGGQAEGKRKSWEKRVPGGAADADPGICRTYRRHLRARPCSCSMLPLVAYWLLSWSRPQGRMPTDLRVLSGSVLVPHPVPVHSALPVLASRVLQLPKIWHSWAWWASPQKGSCQDFGSLWAVCCLLIHHVPISSSPSQPVLTTQYGLCDPHSIHVH